MAGAPQEVNGMTNPLMAIVLVGCISLAVWGCPAAKAEGGRVAFSGAIVEPTCEIQPERFAVPEPSRRIGCPSATAAPGESTRGYVMTVTKLSAGTPDRLLSYFAGYLDGSGSSPESARLVTQTYE